MYFHAGLRFTSIFDGGLDIIFTAAQLKEKDMSPIHTQPLATHRQTNTLTGDVGIREVLWNSPLVHLQLECVHLVDVPGHPAEQSRTRGTALDRLRHHSPPLEGTGPPPAAGAAVRCVPNAVFLSLVMRTRCTVRGALSKYITLWRERWKLERD